jgi:hypothetical protein
MVPSAKRRFGAAILLSASLPFDRQCDNQNQDGQRRDIQWRTKPMKLFSGGVEGLALALQLMHQSSVSPIEPRVKHTDDNKQEPADVLNGSCPDRFHVG